MTTMPTVRGFMFAVIPAVLFWGGVIAAVVH